MLTLGTLNAQDIAAAEYFVDEDPGVGNGYAISVSSSDSVFTNHMLNIAGYGPGFHTLYVRYQNGNGWGLYKATRFYVAADMPVVTGNDISRGEYFIDEDPGFNSGGYITTSSVDSVFTTIPATINGLETGFHTIHIRFMNAVGEWGAYKSQSFYVMGAPASGDHETVSGLESFVDEDPGLGAGSYVNLADDDSTFYTLSLDVSGLSFGDHTLYVRHKNRVNDWGLYKAIPFEVVDCEVPDAQVSSGDTVCLGDSLVFVDQSTGLDVGGDAYWFVNGSPVASTDTLSFIPSDSGVVQTKLVLVNHAACKDSMEVSSLVVKINRDILFENDSLKSLHAGSGDYQWIDCGTDSPIAGANVWALEPGESGNFSLEISDRGCVVRSDCEAVIITAIQEESVGSLEVYPNPTRNGVFFEGVENPERVIIRNTLGVVLYNYKLSDHMKFIELQKDGVYFLEFEMPDGRHLTYKVVKQ